MDSTSVSDERADKAIDWFVRLRAEDVTQAERKRFFAWLEENQANQVAFVEILDLWDGLGVVSQMDVEELRPYPRIFEFRRKAEATA